jgi:hypothetical protein
MYLKEKGRAKPNNQAQVKKWKRTAIVNQKPLSSAKKRRRESETPLSAVSNRTMELIYTVEDAIDL